MLQTFPDLPGWNFAADEVSAGVYRALGSDPNGRSVEAKGLDPEALIQKCRQAVITMMAEAQKSSGPSHTE